METQLPGTAGLLGSLRGFADGMIGSVQERIELFSAELQQEKHRLVRTFVWASALVAAGFLALIFVSVALLVAFWDTARVPVAVALAVAYAGGFAGLAFGFKRFVHRQPRPFEGSLRQLIGDRSTVNRWLGSPTDN